jgi:DNA topoisomerase-1
MGKTLVIVESPAKAKTIKKYLGAKYDVLASKGHIKDLPKKMGVDIEHGFLETYEVIPGKEKVLSELKGAARDADEVLLATDPDREGEAIAWHISEELGGTKRVSKRVEFHEITKKGVERGVANPRPLDAQLYDAQRARRVLDRIVGYDVSALVWSKLAFGLSAGRVQSVALRLIVDREREIEAFKPQEYWNCGAALLKQASARANEGVFARVYAKDGAKLTVADGATAACVKRDLEGARYRVSKVTRSERRRRAPAPYSTSKLQQDAVNRLGFGAKRTMQVAQGLYEGVDLGKETGTVGLITYMRTDSARCAPEAVAAARDHIAQRYGADFVPKEPNVFKSKKGAQDAHEAIRPTSMDLPPAAVRQHLKDEQFKLYRLIWNRFVASQMKDAVYDQTTAEIEGKAATGTYGLRVAGRVLQFAGWLEAYGVDPASSTPSSQEEGSSFAGEEPAEAGDGTDATVAAAAAKASGVDGSIPAEGEGEEVSLPELVEGEAMTLRAPPGVLTEQKFTQPPARYTEGSLVRELEDRGIGRPSTYAEIIGKVQAKDYVEKIEGGRQFRPTTLGKFVVDGLVQSALDFMDPAFTSNMEESLDAVESGTEERVALLTRFYKRFREQLDKGKKGKRWGPEPVPTDETCDACGSGKMSKRWSKNGWFLGCANYPKCKNTRDLGPDGNGPVAGAQPRETGIACDKCGKPMVIRAGRFGEFLSCSGYPACKSARPVPLGVQCPKCGGDIIQIRPKKKGGRTFYGCSNYANEKIKCEFKSWQKPIPEPCPSCGASFLVYGGTKAKPMIACADRKCGYKRAITPNDEATREPAIPGAAAPVTNQIAAAPAPA